MEIQKYGIYAKLDEILNKLCKIEEYYRSSINKMKEEEGKKEEDKREKEEVIFDEYLFGYKGDKK
jgi:hypothetical protein